jgi:hypothetical protein
MAGDRRAEVGGFCQMVPRALSQQLAAMLSEVAFEISTPQAAATSIVTCSTWPPPIGGSRP